MKTFAAISLLGCLAFAAHADAADPRELLARSKQAAGGAAWDHVKTLHSRGRVETGGLSGSADSWDDVLTGRFLDTFELGPVSGADGFDGKGRWSRDPAGEITVSDSGDAREGTANDAYRRSLSYWFPDRRPASLAYEGERQEEGRVFHVLRIHPEGGRPFDLWIDAATFLVDRTVEKNSREVRTNFFSDYREINGLKFPFRLRSTNGEVKYDMLATLESIEVNPAIDAARFSPPENRLDDFEIAGGKSSMTLPFELINNHIYMDLQLDGHGSLRVALDTGGVNVVTPAAAQRLGLKTEGSMQARGVGEGSEDFALARVKEVRFGDARIRNQVFYVLPLQAMDKVEGFEFAGIVGFEVFKRFVVRIDYAKSLLTFTRPEAFEPPAGATVVSFTFDERTPQVEGKIDGIPGKFTMDTGSRVSLTVNRPFAEKNGLLERKGFDAIAGWGVGGGSRGRVTRGRLLELGSLQIPEPVMDISLQQKGSFSDPYLAGNVGGGVLKRFTVTFDYSRQRIYFEPNESSRTRDVYDRAGLWMNREGDGYKVEDVVAGGPAAEAGLRIGDTILAVDGRSAAEMPIAEARQRLKADPGTRVRLTVRSGQETREITVTLRDLV